jgi:hypothetical protein
MIYVYKGIREIRCKTICLDQLQDNVLTHILIASDESLLIMQKSIQGKAILVTGCEGP